MTKINQVLFKIKEQYFNHTTLYNCVILSVLYFANCWNGYVSYFVFLILFCMVIFSEQEEGFSCLVFSVPFCLLKPMESVIMYAVCLLTFFVKYLVKNPYCLKFENSISGVLFVVFLGMQLVNFGEFNYNWFYKFCLIICLYFLIKILAKQPEFLNFSKNVKVFASGIIVSAVFGVVCFNSAYLNSYIERIWLNQNILRYSALFQHTNVLAMVCAIEMSFLCFEIMKKPEKSTCLKLFVALLVIGLSTFSKTFLILASVICLTLFIWSIKNKEQTVFFTFSCTIGFALIFLLLSSTIRNVLFDRFMNNFENCKSFGDFVNLVTTGRLGLWKGYLKEIGSSPINLLFGKGLGAGIVGIESSHNMYITLVYQLGIVGTILLLTCLVLEAKPLFTNLKNSHSWIIVATFLLLFMVEDFVFYINFKY